MNVYILNHIKNAAIVSSKTFRNSIAKFPRIDILDKRIGIIYICLVFGPFVFAFLCNFSY